MKGILNKKKTSKFLLLFIVILTALSNTFFTDFSTKAIFGPISLSQFVTGLFLVVFLIINLSLASGKFWRFISPLILISFFGLASAVWSPFPLIAVVFSFKLFFLVNVFILTATLSFHNILTETNLVQLAKVVILITLIGQFLGLYFGINMYGTEYSSAGLSDNGSVIAAQMLFALTVLLVSGLNNKINYIFYLLILVSIILTLRRSALVGYGLVFITLAAVTLFSSNTSFKSKVKWIFFLVISILFMTVIINNTDIGGALVARITELDPERGGTASGRYSFQLLGLTYAINRDLLHLIFGDGFGASVIVNINNGFIPIGMHSDILDIFIGLGTIGIVYFCIFFFKIYTLSKRLTIRHRHFYGVIGFFVALASISFFTGGFFETNTMLGYICIGFIYGNARKFS